MRNLGLEFLGVFGLPPVDLVHLAADLGCQFIGTVLAPIDYNPEGFPKWNLGEDASMRRALKTALAARDIRLTLGDGHALLADIDVREAYASGLDIYQDLGVERVNCISFDLSLERTYDQFAVFTEMAVERGMAPTIEFCPISVVNDLDTAIGAVRHAGPAARLLIDTMHFFRSESSVDALAVVRDMVGHIQLSDAPRVPIMPDYLEEAMYERQVPGEGEAPLAAIVAALPNVCSIGMEVPLRSEAERGVRVRERMARCLEGARRVIAEADAS